MNILQILPELNVGGVETGTLDLVKYLVKTGHKAVVVSGGGELVKELESIGGIHYQLPVHRRSIFAIMNMVPKLIEIIYKENIDIVHARSRAPAWIAYFACRKTSKIFITTCHGYYKKHPFSYVMGWGKRVIVLSNVIARHMIDDFSVPYERVRLIWRSVDLEKFIYIRPDTKRKEEFHVGIIGRITPLKGHLDFIKAMAKVAQQIPHLKIWIVGDAPASKQAYKEQVQLLTRRLGLWQCTEFLGTQRDIPGILANFDCLVLATTTQEAFGRVIIEAQAAGVPTVATKVGGVVDIIEDEKTGLLIPPSDPESMSAAIIRINKDKALAHRLAQNAYQKVKENYSIELMGKKTLGVYQESLSNYKILIIKFSSLGDIILSTAALRAIRKKFPALADKNNHTYQISFLVSDEAKEILFGCPYIDELLVCDLKNKDRGISGILKLAKILRKKNFDLVIDLQNNRKSHLLAALSLALDRYGYNNKKFGFLLNHSIRDDKTSLDPITHQFRILKLLGIDLEEPHLELWPSEEDTRYIKEFLSSQWISANQKIVGINLSASPRWLTKNWSFKQLVRLCTELSRRDIRVLFTGTEKDLSLVGDLLDMIKDAKLINACAKTTLNQLACLIRQCNVYITGDSAPLHIAASVDTPFVALFGPTDPRRHLPPAKKYIVIKKDLPCSPCYKSKCRHKKCMELITAEEVLEAVEKLLK
jgi:lipopolysaccharide heptosyltransferase II